MAKSKVGLKYAKIVRPSSGASAHSNARKGIVKDCLSRKSGITKESGTYSQRCSNYASGFWAPKLSRKSASYDSEASKSCSVETRRRLARERKRCVSSSSEYGSRKR